MSNLQSRDNFKSKFYKLIKGKKELDSFILILKYSKSTILGLIETITKQNEINLFSIVILSRT